MKSLQITSRKVYLRRKGGVQIYLENLYSHLKKQGHQIYILTPKSRKNKSIQNAIINIKTSKSSKFPMVGYKILPLIKFLIKERENFDIFSIHSHTYFVAPLIIFFLRVILRKSVVLTIHGLNEGVISDKISLNKIAKLLIVLFWRLIAWFSCLMSKKVIFISRNDMKILSHMFTTNISKEFYWIPNSINIQTEDINNNFNNRKYFTFIGTLESRIKGFDIFIQLMEKLHKELKYKIPVLVLGNGPLESLLLRNKENLDIKHLRYVKHNNISTVYKQTKVYILTSRSEGLPTTILEAMVHKVPVLATDIPANRQIIKNNFNGFLFPLNQPKVGFIMLKEILNNKKLRTNFILNARKVVEENFSWEENSKKILKIYSDLRS